jgi:hypothetical protein
MAAATRGIGSAAVSDVQPVAHHFVEVVRRLYLAGQKAPPPDRLRRQSVYRHNLHDGPPSLGDDERLSLPGQIDQTR